MKLYKVLTKDNRSCYSDNPVTYSLPHAGEPGDWMPPVQGDLVACKNGYHLCRFKDLVWWLNETIWEAEASDETLVVDGQEGKVVARTCRILRRVEAWNERTARLFACDVAERVLPIYEREYPTDSRPRQAIDMARHYANGDAIDEELAAARDAARAAARTPAWAARAAARAARAAARDAARAAAWAAEDAARAAARDAARAAAGDAAWAARDAARAAEREWQTQCLACYMFDGDIT